MKILLGLLVLVWMSTSYAGFQGKNAGVSLGVMNKIDCSTGTSCSKTNGALVVTASQLGAVDNVVVASTTTLTAAQCGSTIVYGATFIMTLPEASTVIGCEFTFVVNAVANMDINPQTADQILLLTNAAGDAIRADAVGETIVLRAIDGTNWVSVGLAGGTWTDVD